MKRFAFTLALAMLGWLVAELAAFALLWISDGRPSPPQRFIAERAALLGRPAALSEDPAAAEPSELARLARGGAEEEVLQPYLGYVVNPEINEVQQRREHGRLVVSELGFFEPPTAEPSTFARGEAVAPPLRVGVFGGSGAFIFSFLSREKLAAELEKLPAIQGRSVEVRSFALGGYKQPQQLQALTYLLSLGEQLDVVINIDGFNEVVLPSVQNVPHGLFPFYPSNWSAKVRQIPDSKLDSLRGRIAYLHDRRHARAQLFSLPVLSYSYLMNLVWRIQDHRLSAAIATTELEAVSYKPRTRRYLTHGPEQSYPDEPALFRSLAAVWQRSSLQMHRLCEANGIRYYHFLQPNQYVPNSKVLSGEERRTGFDPVHPYRNAVANGYPYLLDAGRELAASGVNFYDLTDIFKEHVETIYFDTCCHFNQHGTDLIALKIVNVISADLSSSVNRKVPG